MYISDHVFVVKSELSFELDKNKKVNFKTSLNQFEIYLIHI